MNLEGAFLRSAVMELMRAKAQEDEVGYSAPEAGWLDPRVEGGFMMLSE